jgi:hypothetical protein
MDAPQSFVNVLTGMVKFALNKQGGLLPVSRLAAACCHKDATIRKGIEFIAALGSIEIIGESEEALQIRAAEQPANAALRQQFQAELNYLLRETGAFRRFCLEVITDWFVDQDQRIFGEK